MSSTKQDYYEILGVSKDASESDIKKAFRRKAKELHPDTNQSPNAEAQFKELGEAYDVLSHADKRQVYDTYGHDGLQNSGYTQSWDFAGGFPDLNDIFSSFFGDFGFGGQRNQGGPRRGEDIRYDLELTFEEAVFGLKRELEVPRLFHCETCEGSGASPGSGPTVCTGCGGNGQTRQTTQTILGHFTQIVTCPRCQGRGSVIADPCTSCQGQGRTEKTQKINITIPPGVDSGTRLRVSGEGNSGQLGGPGGDLYVVIHVQPHPKFERDGVHVVMQQPVTYTQLVLGKEIDVPTLHGVEKVKIPAGTPNGHVVQLKNQGIPHLNNPNRRGDQYVRLDIQIPTKLSMETKKLLQDLQDLEEGQGQGEAHHSFVDKAKGVLFGGI